MFWLEESERKPFRRADGAPVTSPHGTYGEAQRRP